jgi:hypothetical protein
LYICIVSYAFFVFFDLWTCSYLCILFHCGRRQVNRRFTLGSQTVLADMIFTPGGQFLSSGGIFLGDTTNNVAKYIAVVELLRDALSHGIYCLWVYLYALLVVSQLNGVYRVYDPTLHR